MREQALSTYRGVYIYVTAFSLNEYVYPHSEQITCKQLSLPSVYTCIYVYIARELCEHLSPNSMFA